MNFIRTACIAAFGATIVLGTAAHGDEPAVKARQAQFTLFAYNLGPMAQMAQGQLDYDAEMAQTAADNLARLVNLDQGRHWPEGTDNASIEGTRALPSIWEDLDDFATKFDALRDAAGSLQDVAGTDLASLQGAIRNVGAACAACHDANRAPQ